MQKDGYRATPTVTVYNNQGLLVRALNYYRAQVDEEADIRINLQRYDKKNYVSCCIDARLSPAFLKNQSPIFWLSLKTLFLRSPMPMP